MDNLYHLQNYRLLMKNLVLVILCAGDEISENFVITHDNKTINVNWFSFLENFHHILHSSDMNSVVLRTMYIA